MKPSDEKLLRNTRTDTSEQISFAVAIARRRWGKVFRAWPQDMAQAARMGALQAQDSTMREVWRAANRECSRCARELGYVRKDRRELSTRSFAAIRALRSRGGSAGGAKGAIARWGDFGARQAKARAMRAEGKTLKEIQVELGYKSISAAHYAAKEEKTQ